jgi:hypothetical protein
MKTKLFTLLGAVALTLAGLAGSAPAQAQTSRAQVFPDTDGCESGYGIWQNKNDKYYLGKPDIKVGQPIETTTDNNYCWLFPVSGTYGIIENEAGYCAGWDSTTVTVNLQYCNEANYQEWYVDNDDGTITLKNEYAVDNGYTNLWMEATGDDGPVILGRGAIYWNTCAPPGPC